MDVRVHDMRDFIHMQPKYTRTRASTQTHIIIIISLLKPYETSLLFEPVTSPKVHRPPPEFVRYSASARKSARESANASVSESARVDAVANGSTVNVRASGSADARRMDPCQVTISVVLPRSFANSLPFLRNERIYPRTYLSCSALLILACINRSVARACIIFDLGCAHFIFRQSQSQN